MGRLVDKFLNERENRMVTEQAKALDKAFCLSTPTEEILEVILSDTKVYSMPTRIVQRGTRFLNNSLQEITKESLVEKIKAEIMQRNLTVAKA